MKLKLVERRKVIWAVALILLFGLAMTVQARPAPQPLLKPNNSSAGMEVPNTQNRTHRVGNVFLTVSNWGFFGSQRSGSDDLNCFRDEVDNPGSVACAPSAEFPANSNIEYLFQGAIWIGAIVEGDTFVSVGFDGWLSEYQLYPCGDLTNDSCSIKRRSNIKEDTLNYDSTAVAEDELIGYYTDTLARAPYTPPYHRPIGVRVKQKSLAWSYDYSKDFVYFEYEVTNIEKNKLDIKDMYIGFYMDQDIGHIDSPDYAQDDITGVLRVPYRYDFDYTQAAGETLAIAWIADNDGDPAPRVGVYNDHSPTGVAGVMVLKTPNPDLKVSYNWWISNTNEDFDWGPMKVVNNRGWDGTPEGPKNKYQVLSNGEFDYDQSDIGVYRDSAQWVAPPTNWRDLQDGYDTRYLLSFGPFDLKPDSTINLIIAFVCAEGFHFHGDSMLSVPGGLDRFPYTKNLSSDPNQRYNFGRLAQNARWARRVYDGQTDTSITGEPPETTLTQVHYRGPLPPPLPTVTYETRNDSLWLYWTADKETVRDEVTGERDFEGYRVYMGLSKREADLALLQQWDIRDFKRFDGTGTEQAPSPDSLSGDAPFLDNTGMPSTVVRGGITYYYYIITNLREGLPIYVSVVPFDYGIPSQSVGPMEYNRVAAAKKYVPHGAAYVARSEPLVYPNPYRVDGNYRLFGSEGDRTRTSSEYDRKIHFLNLPEKATIRIFSMNGDLVANIDHFEGGYYSDGPNEAYWTLISRNNQSITSGLYMYSVTNEISKEVFVGRIVIIK